MSYLIIVRVLEFENVLVSALRIAVDQVKVVGDLGIEIGNVLPFTGHGIATTSYQTQVPKSVKDETYKFL